MAGLLIPGVPGTGKTTVAEHLAENFKYAHVDMETNSFQARRELEQDAQTFLGRLASLPNPNHELAPIW